jgi:hypothetical protein
MPPLPSAPSTSDACPGVAARSCLVRPRAVRAGPRHGLQLVEARRLRARRPADAATPGACYRWKSCPGAQVHSARAQSGQGVRPCPPSGERSAASRIAWTIEDSGFFVMASPCTSMMRSRGRASASRTRSAGVRLPALSTADRPRVDSIQPVVPGAATVSPTPRLSPRRPCVLWGTRCGLGHDGTCVLSRWAVSPVHA